MGRRTRIPYGALLKMIALEPQELSGPQVSNSVLKCIQNDMSGASGAQWTTGLEFLIETYSK